MAEKLTVDGHKIIIIGIIGVIVCSIILMGFVRAKCETYGVFR